MTRKIIYLCTIAIALIAANNTAIAQQPPASSTPKEVNFYRLDFVLRELADAKIINSRNYSMWLRADRSGAGSIRVGNDTPVQNIPTQDKPTGLSYKNIGTQLDCELNEIDNSPVVNIAASIGDILPSEANEPKTLPVFRNITFRSAALLTPGKPTIVSSIDDPNSKRRFQLEVTATKLK
jgi:hypothetical protein